MRDINLRKVDIIKSLSSKKGFSKLLSKKITNDLLDILSGCINKGQLNIKNIGTLRVLKKKTRQGRNPKTKENFIIKERKSISFKSSKLLKKLINE